MRKKSPAYSKCLINAEYYDCSWLNTLCYNCADQFTVSWINIYNSVSSLVLYPIPGIYFLHLYLVISFSSLTAQWKMLCPLCQLTWATWQINCSLLCASLALLQPLNVAFHNVLCTVTYMPFPLILWGPWWYEQCLVDLCIHHTHKNAQHIVGAR